MKKLSAAAIVAVLAWCGAAGANPMVTNWAVAVQVPGTMHVQVSYLGMDGNPWPTDLKRDGEALGVKFLGPVGVSHNGGSGVMGYQAIQFCDCFMPAGQYQYEWVGGADWGNTASVFVAPVEQPDLPMQDVIPQEIIVVQDVGSSSGPDAAGPLPPTDEGPAQDMGTDEIFPWDEPEPDWPQGADCRAICEGGTGSDTGLIADVPVMDTATFADVATVDTLVPASDVPGATETAAAEDSAAAVDNAINPVKDDGGSGCNAGAQSSAAGVLVLLVGVFLAFRRQRVHA